MTLHPPKFRKSATVTDLYHNALCVDSEYQAGAYMRGLMAHLRNNYPQYHAGRSGYKFKVYIWHEIKRYAQKRHYPVKGLHQLYGIYAKDA